MHKLILIAALLGGMLLTAPPAPGHDDAHQKAAPAQAPKLENLMRSVLEGVDNTEVIISRVTMPPHTSLPKHWHPGEEFAYVLEGSVTLWQKGEEDIVFRAGEVGVVPLKKIHTAVTQEEGATILVVRIHEVGKPERIPVDD